MAYYAQGGQYHQGGYQQGGYQQPQGGQGQYYQTQYQQYQQPSQHYGEYGGYFQQNVFGVQAWQSFQFQTPDELSHVYHTEMSKNPANAQLQAIQAEDLCNIMNNCQTINIIFALTGAENYAGVIVATVQLCRHLENANVAKSTNIVDRKIEEVGLTCITQHEGFVINCLNQYVVETSFYEHRQENGLLEQNERIHEVYRYLAYRRFGRWFYQRLGRKYRRILPACVASKIRQTFPSQEYCRFKLPQ